MPGRLTPSSMFRSPTAVAVAEIRDFACRIPLHFQHEGIAECGRERLESWLGHADAAIKAIGVIPDRHYESPVPPHQDYEKGRADRGKILFRAAGRILFEAEVLHMMDIYAGCGPAPEAKDAKETDGASAIDKLVERLQPMNKAGASEEQVGMIAGSIIDFIQSAMTLRVHHGGALRLTAPLAVMRSDWPEIEIVNYPFAGNVRVDLYGVTKRECR